MVHAQAVLTGLHVFKREAARCIRAHRALGVLIRAVQYDLAVGDDRTSVVLYDPSNTAESCLPESRCDDIQNQKDGDDRKHLHATTELRVFRCRDVSKFVLLIAMNAYLIFFKTCPEHSNDH